VNNSDYIKLGGIYKKKEAYSHPVWNPDDNLDYIIPIISIQQEDGMKYYNYYHVGMEDWPYMIREDDLQRCFDFVDEFQ